MTKKSILFLFFMFIFLLLFSLTSQAVDELPGESVYASAEKQKEIAMLFDETDLKYLQNKKIWLLTESITPVYYVDVMEYSETGEWKLEPTGYENKKYYGDTLEKETSIYRAKTIFYDGLFAGDITLLVSETEVEIIEFVKKQTTNNISLVSYADHKERVENGRKWIFVNEEFNEIMHYTRYVILGEFGSAFYVKKKVEGLNETYNMEYLVALDSKRCIFGFEKSSANVLDILHFDTDMQKVVDFLVSLKASSNNNPEMMFELFLPEFYNTNNVININEYLKTGNHRFYTDKDSLIGYIESKTELSTESNVLQGDLDEPKDNSRINIVVPILIGVVGIVFFFCFIKFKNKFNQSN